LLGVKNIDKAFCGCNSFNVFSEGVFLWCMDAKAEKLIRRNNGSGFSNIFPCTCGIFYVEALTNRGNNYIINLSKSGSRGHCKMREESPGSTEQGCRLTAGGGDSKDSATENKRRSNLVSVEM